jgi:DNA-binding HxlR family transcriptional regulator
MTKRTYNQTCSVAGALDVLGERWTLLLVRELLTGPKRYNDLLDALPGIGTNLLAERLKTLANDGLISQRRLPAPAAASVYQLTEAGRRLEPVLLELVRWGMRYQRKGISCEFRVADEVFYAEVRERELHTAAGPATQPDVVVATTPEIFRRFESGESPDDLEKTGKWKVSGSATALRKFIGLFEVPARA